MSRDWPYPDPPARVATAPGSIPFREETDRYLEHAGCGFRRTQRPLEVAGRASRRRGLPRGLTLAVG